METQLEHDVVLNDGRKVHVRPIRPADGDRLREGFVQLSLESRVGRFLSPLRALSDADVRYLTEVDGVDHVAVVAVDPGSGRGLGVARYVRSTRDPVAAEVAVTVAEDVRRRGLAEVLLSTLADAARARGIEKLTAEVLSDNHRVRSLLRKLGARATQREGSVTLYAKPLAA